jgi:hypothetical protein
MRSCPNCGNQITCGCQDRIASDGKRVCSSCISFYEQELLEASLNNTPSANENIPS